MKRLIGYALVMIMSLPLAARFHVVKSARQLEKLVDGYEYSVVCFAPSGQTEGEDLDRDDKQDRKKEFRAVQGVVKAASERSEYKNFLSKDVGFMIVDVASRQAEDLSDEYGVHSVPTCFVFEQGAAPDKSKKIMRPASVKDLTRLLEQEGGSALKDLLKDRKEEASLERQERIARNYAYASAYPYWGGYGWGGYGWGWRGRYWGGWGGYRWC